MNGENLRGPPFIVIQYLYLTPLPKITVFFGVVPTTFRTWFTFLWSLLSWILRSPDSLQQLCFALVPACFTPTF